MNDREYVPVTTLAGLTSLSDLLSELPVSDTLSFLTSLNKSLLFHPRVAEEANNLLAVKEETLVRQLVNAIEQTNSDNIELKNQYTNIEPDTAIPISEEPQLLQAIHAFKPTVFNNIIHNNQRNTIVHNQHNQPHLVHNTQAQNILSDQQQQQQYNNHQFYQPHLQQIDQNALNYQHGQQQQQQHNVLQSQPNIINSSHMINLTGFYQDTSNQTITATEPWNQEQPESVLVQEQSKLQSVTQNQHLSQESLQATYIPQQNTNLNYNTSTIVNKTVIQTSQQIPVQQVNQYQQPNNIHYMTQQQQPSQNTFVASSNITQTNNSLAAPVQQNQFSNRTNFNQVLQLQQQNQAVQLQIHQNQISNINNNEMLGNQSGVIQNLEIQHSQNLLPRNNEYLEKQKLNKNLDIRGPSPAKACDALDSNQIQLGMHQQNLVNSTSTDIKTNSENSYDEFSTNNINMDYADVMTMKMKPVVCLNRISPEDQELMQESLTEFVKKSPDLARKLGINHGLIAQTNDESSSIFSKMKNDENRKSTFAGKKRGTIDANLETPGELFTKPKLRKVERKTSTITTKADKEDIQKSNTYQRFNTFMDKIFELLDETEGPLNIEDGYDNVDCITSNLLNNISSEAAKLKARGFIDWLPQNKLTLLITYAMRSIHVAKNISAGPDSQEEFLIEESLEKILNAIEASLLVCNIYSCRSTSFLQEDNIDAIVKFVQFQLRETIFPSFDPVYTVETKKKHDNKKSKKAASQQKEITVIYSKIVELTKVLLSLFFKFQFEDTIVIHASALGVEPFFVDNIDTLQFVCLDLVTTIFQNEKYSHHRGNILNDILSSVDRLPCSKRNLRPFKLAGNGGNIQMVTALVLQLIQCSVVLPEHLNENITHLNKKRQNNETKTKIDKDVFIREKYDTALSIGGNFLTTFLNKCKTRSGETDFRPLFENFIQDLLTTVNRPEWPAAELLLSLLGTLLVRYMSDKNVDQPIRVASLEYLGIVAARLRKDTVESRCKVDTMDQLIKCIKIEQEKEGDKSEINNSIELDPEEIRTEFLEKILLDYLAVKAHDNNLALEHARHFCLTQWYRDILLRKKKIADGEKGYASRKKNQKKRRRHKDETDSESSEDDDNDEDVKQQQHNPAIDQELNLEIFRALDQRKKYFLSQIARLDEANTTSAIDIKTYIDYSNAHLIAQYLASKRSFSQSFDKYLQKIILVVQEQSIAIRTKAMKCLAMIVEVDPSILQRKDMQMGVHHKFLDPSISVREAAVDLVGKYVLSSPELIRQYYEILSLRILDTGVSVRKRVIKILRDICEVYPDFEKIPEICVKMIRRVNDEEGIQKLVTEVFMNMWFTPCDNDDQVAMNRKIAHITTVVSESQDSGTQWLEGLLKSIFESKESKEDTKVKKEPSKTLVLACQQIADGLVLEIVKLEEKKLIDKLLGCVITLHLFAKIRPQLLVHHAISLEPYLNIKLNNDSDVKFISCVAEILEQIVPLIENPSDSFLADLELHLMTLVVSHKQTVVQYCLACLGAIVNKITKNYKLIRDCFCKFYYKSIAASKDKMISTPDFPLENLYKPFFRRSIYTIGLIMRYFDFKNPIVYGTDIDDDNLPENICDEVYETLMYFVTCSNINIKKATLISLGSFCVKNFEYLTKPELRDFYQDLLIRDHGISTDIKVTVLRNIFMYLNEAEQILVRNENEWSKQAKNENLKEMGDVHSGMASRVIQLYIKEVLYCFLDQDFGVRFWAMRVVEVVLKQGLVHPVQIVPYLICLGTDSEKEVSHCADHHLQDIDKQYPGFINMKSQAGLQLSYELQIILQKKIGNKIVRGYRIKQKDEPPSALNGFLYSLLRNAKPQRRALIQSITKQFDDTKSSLRQMLYLSDNLAYFPYGVQDEPLYLIHQVDVLISVTGTNLLSAFREGLKPVPGAAPVEQQTNQSSGIMDEDEEDDKDVLYGRLPEDTTDLEKCIRSAQGCMLLLILKQHLKDSYGITDSKISRYSPSEPAKIYDKAIQRRLVSKFNPKSTVDVLEDEDSNVKKTEENKRRELIIRYLEFKQLMLKLDPDDPDADDDDKPLSKSTAANKNATTIVEQQQPNVNTEKFNMLPATNNIIIKNTNVVTNNTTSNVVTTKDEQGGHRTSSGNTKVKQTTKTKSPKKTPRKKKKKSYAVSSSDDSDYSDYE